MVRALVQRAFDASKMYFEFVGLSTDDKPKAGICTGSMSPVPLREDHVDFVLRDTVVQ